MSRDLEVVSWNLKDGLNDPQVHTSLLETEADIAVLPEALAENDSLDTRTTWNIQNAGYDIYHLPYNDADGRSDRHQLAVIAKPELIRQVDPVVTNGRNSIRVTLHNDTQLMGVHLFDRQHANRTGGEIYRQQQAMAVVRALGRNAIIAGDFNAMHRKGGMAPIFRGLGPVANMLPYDEPGEAGGTKFGRLGSIVQRLSSMATGDVMAFLHDHNFKDADEQHTPTMVQGPIKAQLDHILYRGSLDVITPTAVDPADNLSDHNRIRATLRRITHQ